MPFTDPTINPAPPAVTTNWAPHQINMQVPPPATNWAPHQISGATLYATRPPCVTELEATTYFASSHNNAAWQALTGDERTTALTAACRWLGTLCWDASLNCCDKDFINAWIMASSELALALHQNPTAIISGPVAATQQGTFTKRQKLGELEVEYAQLTGDAAASASAGSKVGPKAPLVLQKHPWLVDILGCWLKTPTGSSRVLSRCC